MKTWTDEISPARRAVGTNDATEGAAGQAEIGASRAARWGRPRREFAGQVEKRILEAAKSVFLDRGLEGATIDEIAERARSGKPTIYARFSNKGEIFRAVVALELSEDWRAGRLEAKGPSAEERLRALAAALVECSIAPERVDFMRSLVAESRRFPELAHDVLRMVRDRNAELIPPLLQDLTNPDLVEPLPALGPDKAAEAAQRFVELVVLPLAIRALFGENVMAQRDEVDAHITNAVTFFLAAIRSDA